MVIQCYCFYFDVKYMEQVIHERRHECTILVHYYVFWHLVITFSISLSPIFNSTGIL